MRDPLRGHSAAVPLRPAATREERAEAEIPTASMADIAFLLIIYFMVTTVFSATKGMDLPPPEEPPEAPAFEPSIYLRVLPDGSLEADGRPMPLEGLLAYVVPKLRVNRAKPIILHAEPEAPYRSMVRVYDELRDSERKTGFAIRNVTIPTQREIEEYLRMGGRVGPG